MTTPSVAAAFVRRAFRSRPGLALALAALAAAGCVTTEESVDNTPFSTSTTAPKRPTRPASEGGTLADGATTPGAPSAIRAHKGRVLAEVLPVGSIPYDDMTLPLVDPSARFVATQVGLPPEWSTILAADGASVPATTRIEIYEVPTAGGTAPRLRAMVEEPVLLGRGANAAGFLVEAPREDGARWIGLASWEDGSVTWLVDDHAVNAFAALGPDGRLAWCTRPVAPPGDGADGADGADDRMFRLVVRRGDVELRPPAEGHWLMPVWAGATDLGADGLFAMVLRGDRLDAVAMVAESDVTMRRTVRTTTLAARGATVDTAYQALVTHAGPVAGGRGAARLTFHHPTRGAAAVWVPPAAPVVLDREAIAAVLDPADEAWVIVTRPDHLVRRKVDDDIAQSRLIAGMHIVRPTADPVRQYVLFQPASGVLGMTVMRLIAAE